MTKLNKIICTSIISGGILLQSCSSIKWTKEDTIFQAARLSIMVLDYSQTRDIVSRPTKFHENNLILGEHPSMSSVNTYFAVYGIVDTLIAIAIPGEVTYNDVVYKPRRYWQELGIFSEALVVGNNARIGLRFKF